jgi:hypothetical protein
LSYFVSTRWGGDEREPTAARMREILLELDAEDTEHPGASLTHESEWSLGAYPGGLLTWENGPRHPPPSRRKRTKTPTSVAAC